MIPTAEEQVQFLLNIQRLLNEGVFTATYKYALLLALADIAVECDAIDDTLKIPVSRIAEKYIAYYWRQTLPYAPKGSGGKGIILQQNTDRQAALVRYIDEAKRKYGDCLTELMHKERAWRGLVSSVQTIFWNQPLWRLQRVGDSVVDFLYENRKIGARVESIDLRPGVAFCLRRFHVLISELVRGAWVQYIRRVNADALGATTDISEFLFGSDRCDLSPVRPILAEIQKRRCFYCRAALNRDSNDIDHFVPWSRYPVDLAHNFVLAHGSCNRAKGTMLASHGHLMAWTERNSKYGEVIATECGRIGFMQDVHASTEIARWAYEQDFAAGSFTWIGGKQYVQLTEEWRAAFAVS